MIHQRSSLKALLLSNPNKAFLLGVSSMVLLLTGCDNGKNLNKVDSSFFTPWEKLARNDPDYIVNDVSRMQKEEPRTVSDVQSEQIEQMDPAPITPVNNEPIDPTAIGSATNQAIVSNVANIPETSVSNPNLLVYNPKNIFGKDLQNDSARIDRLERAVQDMRNDFNLVEPSIRRLMVIENDMQRLVAELEKLNASNSGAASNNLNRRSASTPRASSSTKKSMAAAPSSSMGFVKKSAPPVSGKPAIYDLRVGEHSDKTRIVMDVNSKTDFSVDIDNNERIMIVNLPNADWSARTSQAFAKSPFISSYKVEPSDNGNLVVFQLKKNAKVGYKADLKGFEGTSRRLVLDITG